MTSAGRVVAQHLRCLGHHLGARAVTGLLGPGEWSPPKRTTYITHTRARSCLAFPLHPLAAVSLALRHTGIIGECSEVGGFFFAFLRNRGAGSPEALVGWW